MWQTLWFNASVNATVDVVIAQVKETKVHISNLTRHAYDKGSLLVDSASKTAKHFEKNFNVIGTLFADAKEIIGDRFNQTPDYWLLTVLTVTSVVCVILAVLLVVLLGGGKVFVWYKQKQIDDSAGFRKIPTRRNQQKDAFNDHHNMIEN